MTDVDPATVAELNAGWQVEVPETDTEALLREAAEDTPGGVPAVADNTGDGQGEADTGEGRWRPPAESKPFLPAWWHSDQRWEVIGWHVNYRVREAIRLALFLATMYWLRAARRTPRGIGRTVAATWRWVFDHESLPVRRTLSEGTTRHEAVTFLAVRKQRDERTGRRGTWVLAGVALLAGGLASIRWVGPWWLQAATVALGLIVFGKAGSDAADPIIDRRVITPRIRKLDPGTIERAFEAAGLSTDKRPISIPVPIVRDGPGWAATIDLDFHYTAEQAIKRREQLAAGLDFDETQVWLDRVRGTAGSARRLRLWVADEDPFEQSAGPWPLLKAGTVNVFAPFPFGTDQRARLVAVMMMFTGLLIGALPRIGKTNAGRITALACALDPIVELHIWDGKGGSDWRAFTAVAHRAGFGARREVAAGLLADLEDIQKRMNTRYDTIARLGPEMCPDSQVTRDLAERRGLGLWPIGVWIDEFQRYTSDPEHGASIVDVLIDIAKIGPAVGIFLVLMTQKPDSVSIPTPLRDVIGTRLGMHVKTWQSSETILGAGSKAEGYNAAIFRRSDKGVGWLVGADDSGNVEDARITRTYYVSTEQCGPIIDRARSIRSTTGLLTGIAAGEETPIRSEDPTVFLVDLLSIWPAGIDKVPNARLAELLADQSSRYAGWEGKDVTAAASRHGIGGVQINRLHDPDGGERSNLRGTARTDVETALAHANQTASNPPEHAGTGGRP